MQRVAAIGLLDRESKSETTGPAEWVRGSNPAALGLLFLRLAAHLLKNVSGQLSILYKKTVAILRLKGHGGP